MKINFENFQIQNWMLQTVKTEKANEKDGIICLFSMFLFWVMVFKLSTKVHFGWFFSCTDLSKKPNSVKVIYIYASEISHYTLSENHMVYKCLSHRSWDINDQNIKKDADSAKI